MVPKIGISAVVPVLWIVRRQCLATAAACALCDCVWQSAEGRSTVQGRKLKGATAGEPVSGGPADSVVRACRFVHGCMQLVAAGRVSVYTLQSWWVLRFPLQEACLGFLQLKGMLAELTL